MGRGYGALAMFSKRSPSRFSQFAKKIADLTGRPVTFGAAVLILLIWAVSGPIFHFSDTWQLVINTGTTIVTFLMVFLIQNTQNRDAEAIQIKLDELIRARKGAHNELLDLEEFDAEELHRVRMRYEQLAERARQLMDEGKLDTDVPDLPEIVEDMKVEADSTRGA